MASTTPSWTDGGGTVIAFTTLPLNGTVRGTLDLRGKYGARLFAAIGRTATTALTNGVDLRVQAVPNNDGIRTLAPVVSRLSQFAAGVIPTISATNIGDTSVVVSANTSLVKDDLVYIHTPTTFANGEFARISRINGTTIQLDAPLKLTHSASDNFANKADAWSFWLSGGSVYEVIFDYGDDAAGGSVRVVCYYQTYDSDTTV